MKHFALRIHRGRFLSNAPRHGGTDAVNHGGGNLQDTGAGTELLQLV